MTIKCVEYVPKMYNSDVNGVHSKCIQIDEIMLYYTKQVKRMDSSVVKSPQGNDLLLLWKTVDSRIFATLCTLLIWAKLQIILTAVFFAILYICK